MENNEEHCWSMRLTVDRNEVDYLLLFAASTGTLSVDVPLLELPTAVRQLSLQNAQPDTEARILARGQALIWEALLVIAGAPPASLEWDSNLVSTLKPTLLSSLAHLPESKLDNPLLSYVYRQLALDGKRKKASGETTLALQRFVEASVQPREVGKAAGVLLRNVPTVAVPLIAGLFAYWTDEKKRQVLSRFERAPHPMSRTFLLNRLTDPRNETYAEGIVTGLKPHKDDEVLAALRNYLAEPRSYSPQTLVGIARWLTDYPGPAAEASLLRLVDGNNLQAATAAGKGLRQRGYGRAAMIARIAHRLSNDNEVDRAVSWSILHLLDWNEPEQSDDLWARFVSNLEQHPRLGVSGMAPTLFKHLPLEEIYRRIGEGLNHPSLTVRAGVLLLFERLKNRTEECLDESFIRRLIPLLEDEAYEVRRVIGHLLSGLLRRPLSAAVTEDLLAVYASSSGQSERLLTIIGCWVVLFQANDFDSRVEAPLLASIHTESRPVLLAAWRLLRSSPNPAVQEALVELRGAGTLEK